jgi:prolyl-tRNA editing enzyme YbaK/EbsC (Cys-tRNA(Pro) deacylase)
MAARTNSAALERKVAALEEASRSVPHNIAPSSVPATCDRVIADAQARSVLGAALYRVPSHYYSLSLTTRASLLGCPADRLCKTLLFENLNGTALGGDAELYRARYFAVIVQYVAKVSLDALIRLLRPAGSDISEPRLAMVPPEVAARLTGFGFNGVSPLGMAASMPVVVAKAITELPAPAFVWLGGGEPDVKLRLFVTQMLRPGVLCGCARPAVLDISAPRDADDIDAGGSVV